VGRFSTRGFANGGFLRGDSLFDPEFFIPHDSTPNDVTLRIIRNRQAEYESIHRWMHTTEAIGLLRI
jgi:hypothetical protein